MSSEIIRNKWVKNFRERYGVDNPQQRREIRDKTAIMNLSENDIEYDREFRIDRSFYDFRILNSNILLEVNPSFTHNSTISIHGKYPISEDYHYNKTKLAVDNGFICLNIFEWVDPDLVIALIKKSDLISEFVGIEKHELHGWLIYDSGFKISSRTDRNICI